MNTLKYIGLAWSDMNCWALVKRIYKDELDVDLPDEAIQDVERSRWVEVERGREHALDLLLFNTVSGPHVGLVLGSGRMIHSDEVNGVVTERYKNAVIWKNRLRSIYRLRDA
jgi:cell wall-associated NlpC family hydrolase